MTNNDNKKLIYLPSIWYKQAKYKLTIAKKYIWRRVQWYIIRKSSHLCDKRTFELIKDVPDNSKALYVTLLKNMWGVDNNGIDSMLLTKKVIDKIIILQKLMSIQPMNGPVGLVYKLGFEIIDGMKTLNISPITIEAKTRSLAAYGSLESMEAMEDMERMGIDTTVDGVIDLLSSEIAQEIINEHLHNLSEVAEKVKFTGDTTSPANILLNIHSTGNMIAVDTKRGIGNRVLMSSLTYEILADHLTSTKSIAFVPSPDVNSTSSIIHMGTTGSGIDIFVNPMQTDNKILVSYVGNTNIDAGYVFSPYFLNLVNIVADDTTFLPVMKFKTRYATSADDNTSNYYKEFNLQ